ncbi:MAG: hypothetical protein NWQ46_08985 [Spirosomaceae bacterium]|nr:hypothetical protein [Spirosomataceae bacterium]
MTLDSDFIDFIQLLNQHKVDYLVVGGYAMAFHGRPRYTGDLDIWINISQENASRMIAVLKEFGFSSLPFTESDFLKENIINQIGYPPLRIDILTSVDGVSFIDAKKHFQTIEVDELKIRFIGLAELIQNKKASGRKQDLVDIETLKKNE